VEPLTLSESREKLSNRRAFKRVDEKRVLRAFADRGVRSVLDVGCGVGNTVARLRELGFDAWGVTINPDEIAASKVADRLFAGDIQAKRSVPNAPFDAIISLDCLEHLENPLAALRNINAMLRDGGLFVCYIPPEKWIECDYHVIVYTPRQMRWLLNLSGLRLTDCRGRYRGKGVTYYCVKESAGQLEPGPMR